MEQVSCNLCGSEDSLAVLSAPDRLFSPQECFHLVRCSSCGLVYTNPRPTADEMSRYYPAIYYTAVRDIARKMSDRVKAVGWLLVKQRLTPPVPPGGQLLDIGCSGGSYLVAMQKAGWDVSGIEADEDTAQYARDHHGVRVHAGLAENVMPTLPDNAFDVITLWHTLEHFHDPSGVVAEIARVLKPGGLVMIEVPNFRSVSRRMFNQYWYAIDLPRHLYHFTPASLRALLTRHGLEITHFSGVHDALAFTGSLQLIRNERTSNPSGYRLWFSPTLLLLAFPSSLLLSRFALSSAMVAHGKKAGT